MSADEYRPLPKNSVLHLMIEDYVAAPSLSELGSSEHDINDLKISPAR
jgi:hypothetical protein